MPTLKERVATLEQQNLDTETGRKEVRQDIKDIRADVTDLKVGQEKAQTTLDLLVTNGHQKPVTVVDKAKGAAIPIGGTGGVIGLVWFLLEKFQTGG